jgi:hypothetical protein
VRARTRLRAFARRLVVPAGPVAHAIRCEWCQVYRPGKPAIVTGWSSRPGNSGICPECRLRAAVDMSNLQDTGPARLGSLSGEPSTAVEDAGAGHYLARRTLPSLPPGPGEDNEVGAGGRTDVRKPRGFPVRTGQEAGQASTLGLAREDVSTVSPGTRSGRQSIAISPAPPLALLSGRRARSLVGPAERNLDIEGGAT